MPSENEGTSEFGSIWKAAVSRGSSASDLPGPAGVIHPFDFGPLVQLWKGVYVSVLTLHSVHVQRPPYFGPILSGGDRKAGYQVVASCMLPSGKEHAHVKEFDDKDAADQFVYDTADRLKSVRADYMYQYYYKKGSR